MAVISIPLTQGKVALVDEEDVSKITCHKWQAVWDKDAQTFYAKCNMVLASGKRGNMLMHRFILNAQRKQDVDHENHDGLDNRRKNMRLCSRRQNSQNRLKRPGRSSVYKGVTLDKRSGRWQAGINVNGTWKYLGKYIVERDAAVQYDIAAVKYFGIFACTNFGDRKQVA